MYIEDVIKIVKKIWWKVLLGIFALIFVLTSFYTVNETEQAVITTFGKVTSVETAGLHFKLPWPIQGVKKVAVNKTQKLIIGYDANDNTIPSEAKMITGDFNIVNIDFFIEWKVSDPKKYLYNSDQPEYILKMVAQATARSIISSKNVDDVLTTGKTVIQAEIKEKLLKALEDYDLGIQVIDIKIQDAEPPTDEVLQAFKAVETAKQERETRINEANAYKNKSIPEAQSQADKLVRDAESYKESRINAANGEVAKFNAMYAEYEKNPSINKTRMYLETLEQILPGITVYIDTGNGSIDKLLPLDDFAGKGGN